MGRLRPNRRDRMDVRLGLAAVERLAAFGTGPAVVVARAYVLAIAAGEPLQVMLGRVRALRQWGMRGGRRVGVLTCRAGALKPSAFEAVCDEALGQNLSGVVLTGAAEELRPYQEMARLADARQLFLITCASDDEE
jgi:hypothetical protein